MTNTRKSKSLRRLHAVAASVIPVVGLISATTGFAADTTWKGGGTTPNVIKDATNWTNGVPATNKEGLINDSVTIPSTLFWGDSNSSLGGSETLGALTLDSTTLTSIVANDATPGTATTYSIAFVGNTGNTIPLISLGPDVTQAVSILDNSTSPNTILNIQLGTLSSGIGVTNASASLTIGSRIVNKSGVTTANLIKTGAGALALTNTSNSYTGQVQISGGTLTVAVTGDLGTAANTVELDGGAFSVQPTAALTLARSVIVDSNGGTITTSSTSADTTTLSSPFGGTGTVTKNGTAELILNNAAGTFNGIINVAAGNLRFINPGSTAAGTTVQLTGTNSTLNLRADTDSTYNANVEATVAPVQIFVANQSAGITGHTLSVGSIKLANLLNIGATAATNYTVGASQINLAGNGTIATNTTSMNITGGIAETVAGSVFTKAGASSLTINGSTTYTGGTKVLAGNLILKSASAWNAALNGPGVTDVQNGNINGNGTLTFDYTGTTTPVSTVRSAIKSGQIEDTTATAGIGLGYSDNGTSQVKIMPAYFGDTNLDGTVDSSDFANLAAHFGEADSSVSWANGDFNYDGTVNALDFNALATNYGLPVFGSQIADSAVPLGTLVPEPTSLISLAAFGLLTIRRRRAV